VSFAGIILCVASQRVFVFVVYFVIDPVRKLLDAPSYLKLYFVHDYYGVNINKCQGGSLPAVGVALSSIHAMSLLQ
jgi:hypothetical protein